MLLPPTSLVSRQCRAPWSRQRSLQAAHDTLVYLYPHYVATFDADSAQDLAAISGAASQAGAAVGQQIATQVIALTDQRRLGDQSAIHADGTRSVIGRPIRCIPRRRNDARLGQRDSVCDDQRQSVPPATASGAGQPAVHGRLQRVDSVRRRWNHHGDGADRGSTESAIFGATTANRACAARRDCTIKSPSRSPSKWATPKWRTLAISAW